MVLGERLRSWRSSMKRWRRGVMATLIEQEEKGTLRWAAGSVHPAHSRRKSVQSTKEAGSKVQRRAQEKKGLEQPGARPRQQGQPSGPGHRGAVSFNGELNRCALERPSAACCPRW